MTIKTLLRQPLLDILFELNELNEKRYRGLTKNLKFKSNAGINTNKKGFKITRCIVKRVDLIFEHRL